MALKAKNLFWLVVVVLLSVPTVIAGQGEVDIPTESSGLERFTNPLNATSLSDFIKQALEVVRDIGFIVAILFIVYAGFLFVTAQGNEEKLKRAKNALTWAIVGTVVILGAWIFAEAIGDTVTQLGKKG